MDTDEEFMDDVSSIASTSTSTTLPATSSQHTKITPKDLIALTPIQLRKLPDTIDRPRYSVTEYRSFSPEQLRALPVRLHPTAIPTLLYSTLTVQQRAAIPEEVAVSTDAPMRRTRSSDQRRKKNGI
jgi:hypothetical protein